MTCRGHVKNGVIVLDTTNPLPDGKEVIFELVENVVKLSEDSEHPCLKMIELPGPTGIPDLATNHDHYLYGHPKVEDEH
jgi:hypothetical protein